MKRAKNAGFTLIELLTVIAIIAILAAVLFPVFASVRNNAKRTGCSANLHSIGTGLAMYKLDNRRCPLTLLGFYDPAKPMEQARGGLYPEYVKSIKAFKCGGAPSGAGEIDSPTNALTILDANGNPLSVQFYKGDSYDYVDVDGNGTNFMASYAYMWAPTEAAVAAYGPYSASSTDTADFARQLRFKTPDANTVVTWCMNHASSGGGMAVVLFYDGSIDNIPAAQMTPTALPGGKNVIYRVMPNP